LKARTLADLRAVPPYSNQASLLTTADVHKAVQEQGAIFVDVRYPGEFNTNHLPGDQSSHPANPNRGIARAHLLAATPAGHCSLL
jgi:rhodanese-related sulfurtransferase